MGFCSRCGDLVRNSANRCQKCGGRPAEGTLSTRHDPREKSNDVWMSKYLARHISKAAESDELSETSEPAVLGNLVGSKLQPAKKIDMWSCCHCRKIFTPSATIYNSPDDKETRLCQTCFRTAHIRGSCYRCFKDIYPDHKYIHLGKYHWHKSCFACVGCKKDVSEDPMVDLDKRPCCVECFEKQAGHVPSGSVSPAKHVSVDATKLAMKELTDKLNAVKLARNEPQLLISDESSNPSSPISSPSLTASSNSRPMTPITPFLGTTTDKDVNTKVRETIMSPPVHDNHITRVTAPISSPDPKTTDMLAPLPSINFTDTRPRRPTHKSNSISLGSLPLQSFLPLDLYTRRMNAAPSESKDLVLEKIPCMKCGETVGPKATTPAGKVYHVECLKCTICHGKFDTPECIELGGEIYHQKCAPIPGRGSFVAPTIKSGYGSMASSIWASRKSAPKFSSNQAVCPRCRQNVVFIEQTPGPMNSKWHKRCLNCYSCHKPLDSSAKVLPLDATTSRMGSPTPSQDASLKSANGSVNRRFSTHGYNGVTNSLSSSHTLSRSASIHVGSVNGNNLSQDDQESLQTLSRVFCRACYDSERVNMGLSSASPVLGRSSSVVIRR